MPMSDARRAASGPAPDTLWLLGAFAIVTLAACGRDAEPPAASDPEHAAKLVLYTSLPDDRAAAVADAYGDATGVIVNVMTDSDAMLIDKLVRKEHYPGADVLLISGTGHLAMATDSDVLRPIDGPAFDAVPDAYRDPDGFWFGVGVRAELIVYDRRAVDAASLGGYASLADDGWRGRLCLRPGASERSRALVAALIAALGEREAELVVRGWRANLAQSLFDAERDLLFAIESGECAVGIAGSDEVARFLADGLADNLRYRFPTDDDVGTQIGLTAAGVARHANDPALAARFVEWLVSLEGQTTLQIGSFDYPVLGQLAPATPLDGWPSYSRSSMSPSRIGYRFQDATLLVERARYR